MFEGLLQPMHLVLILGIALVVFGPKKLPDLGRGLGLGIRGFRDAVSGATETPRIGATEAPRDEDTRQQ